MNQHPLFNFFAVEFNQDFLLDAPDWQGVIEIYRLQNSQEQVEKIAMEIATLLATDISNLELETLLSELGCFYTPRPDLGGSRFERGLGSFIVHC